MAAETTPSIAPFTWTATIPISTETTEVSKRWVDGMPYDMALRQAESAYRHLNAYERTGNTWYLTRARAQADYLISVHVAWGDAWYLPNTFSYALDPRFGPEFLQPPWYSGIAQGTAVGAFARLWRITGEEAYRDAAEHTLESFLVRRAPRGMRIAQVDSAGYLQLQQYPSSGWTYVYNGHLQAAIGIYDYYRITGDERALALYRGAVSSAIAYGEPLRTRGWVSSYALAPRATYVRYHRRTGLLLLELYRLTGDVRLGRLATEYDDDYALEACSGVVSVQAGVHEAVRLTPAGVATATVTVPARQARLLRFAARERVRNLPGYWFSISEGVAAGYRIAETPGEAYVRGSLIRLSYEPPLPVTLRTGRWPLVRLDEQGRVVASRRVYLRATTTRRGTVASRVASGTAGSGTTVRTSLKATLAERAIVDGMPSARIASGACAGWWIPQAAVRLP